MIKSLTVAFGVFHAHNNLYKFLLILENILNRRRAWHFTVSKCGAEIASQTLLLDRCYWDTVQGVLWEWMSSKMCRHGKQRGKTFFPSLTRIGELFQRVHYTLVVIVQAICLAMREWKWVGLSGSSLLSFHVFNVLYLLCI